MKLTTVLLTILMVFCFSVGSAFGEEGPLKTVQEGCKKELETFCKDVTPGEGRILACLYAYGDKISFNCEYALYDAAAQLERALTVLTYLANECKDDLKSYCAEVMPGEGRLLDCLKKNDKKISERCKTALKDVGVE